jgi:hypothetical protein
VVNPQQSPSPSTTSTKNSLTPDDQSIINQLGGYARNLNPQDLTPLKSNNVLMRAGAIDALGTLGAGADQATISAIVTQLDGVFSDEFIAPTGGKPPMQFKDVPTSQFLCFRVVQALSNLGWGARGEIPKMQLLRGQNGILDTAIDQAISAMQNSPPPPSPSPSAGTQTGTTTPQTMTPPASPKGK